MPLDFKELQGVGIKPDLITLTGADTIPGSQEGLEEVRGGKPAARRRFWPPELLRVLVVEEGKQYLQSTVHDLQAKAGFALVRITFFSWIPRSTLAGLSAFAALYYVVARTILSWSARDTTFSCFHRPPFQHENARSKDAFLAKPKGAPKDKLSYYRVAPYYYFQVSNADTTGGGISSQ